jgi:parallel beta helix pectate lyase-like protein
MKRILRSIAVLVAAAALMLPWMSQANAQNVWSHVSTSGNDANDCASPATACRTWGEALNKTADSGAILCVNAGHFGFAFIDRSVTIDCLAGGNAQTFEINAPGKTVTLRHVSADSGHFGGGAPIEIVAASQVYIEDVMIARSPGAAPGIHDHRAGPAVLVIKNSSIVNNAGPGIVIAPASGIIGVDLENVTSAYNTFGLAVGTGGRVTIKNSFFTNNSVAGIESDGGTFLNINGSQVAFNETGVLSHGSTTLNQTQILSNTTAINGATQSTGNNLIVGNSTDGTAPTIISTR